MKLRDMNQAQRKKLYTNFWAYVIVGMLVLGYFCTRLAFDRDHAKDNWDDYLADPAPRAELVAKESENATQVTVGTYVDNLREINMKSSYFRVEFSLWFNWTGPADLNPAGNFRIYKGLEHERTLIREVHDGDTHYQLVGVDVSVSKEFVTKRFPLESHQLRFYVESLLPIQEIVFVSDYENSGLNRNLHIAGYDYERYDMGVVSYMYDTTHGDPTLQEKMITSELVTALEINRSSWGLYFKCFIALLGTITWVLISLYINTYHHVDPLGMIPGALFGTVSNILVGANLLPDALEMGLIEYVNLWGVLTIIGVSVAIININRIRKKHQDNEFAHLYGTVLFYTILAFGVSGQVIMPLIAYIR